MADKTTAWNGSVSGEWTTAGNWSNGAPNTDGSNDTLIFPSNAARPPTTGLDRLAAGDNGGTGLQPKLVYIQRGASYDLGQPGGELVVRAMKMLHLGNGTLHYKSGGSSGNDTLDVTIDSPNVDKAAVLTLSSGSDFVRIGVAGGKVFISLDTTTLPQLHVAGNNAEVILNPGTGEVTLMSLDRGIVESNVDVDLAVVRDGILTLNGPAYTMRLVVGGGEVAYNVIGGTITALWATGGTTDLLALQGRELTVSNLIQFPRADVVRDEAGDVVVVTDNRTFGLDTE